MSSGAEEAVRRELAEQERVGDAGEATGVFLHELGNVLNNILIDSRMMLRDLPEEYHDRLRETCRLITTTAEQLKALARFRQECRPSPYPVDVNQAVREALAGDRWGPVEAALADVPLPVTATAGDLKRVIRLLLENAREAAGSEGPTAVRTGVAGGKAELTVEDAGPGPTEEDLASLFEPFRAARGGRDGLRLAVCKNLVRRMGGQLEVDPGGAGGLSLTARWPLAR